VLSKGEWTWNTDLIAGGRADFQGYGYIIICYVCILINKVLMAYQWYVIIACLAAFYHCSCLAFIADGSSQTIGTGHLISQVCCG
jgi:hypothetical protein